MKKAPIKKVPALSKDDTDRLHNIALGVWDYIGHDCLTAVQECAETAAQRRNPTMTREEVLEVVIDADRLREAVRSERHRTMDEAQRERLITFLKDAPYEQVLATLRPAFGFARYGF